MLVMGMGAEKVLKLIITHVQLMLENVVKEWYQLHSLRKHTTKSLLICRIGELRRNG